MLDVLLESSTAPPRPNPATVFSVVVHTVLIVFFVVGREKLRPEAYSGESENVRYLIPLDRVKAPPPLAVRVHWHGAGLVGESAGSTWG